jgi:D-glycero-D-manno-heptose 1,7-bisphosphate phosphatase
LNLAEHFKGWTVFLDRDGVINHKLANDYVKDWSEFRFCENALLALSELSKIFKHIVVVTNQRGVGKGLFSQERLNEIHEKMLIEIENSSGKIDGIFICTDTSDDSICRKPNTGMAIKAKQDFPEIEFYKSFIVGDSLSDMEFEKKLGMKRVYVAPKNDIFMNEENENFDFRFNSLHEFAMKCKNLILD